MPACTAPATICQAGKCICPYQQALCGGACIDVMMDVNHCGSCTKTCKDGCSAGRCYTTLVQPSNSAPVTNFAVNATHVFFVNRTDGKLSRIPRGGGTPTVLATGQYYAGQMALDADNLYWLDGGNVLSPGGVIKMPLAGGTYTEFVTGEPSPICMVLDATNVYWSDYSPHFIKKVPKAGGDVVVLVSEDNADRASNLAIDSKNLYWTSLVGGGTVFKLPLAGTSVAAIAEGVTGVDNAGSLTAGNGNVYFISSPQAIRNPQTIRKVSSAGGAASNFQRSPRQASSSPTIPVFTSVPEPTSSRLAWTA